MAKKPPSRGKLLQLKPKPKSKARGVARTAGRGKVLPLPPKKKPKPKSKPARPRVRPQPMPPPLAASDNEERLREAMEELTEARAELSRLGHALSAAHRELQDRQLSSGSAEEHLRAELEAVRTDLKTALAELEISRNEVQRLRAKLAVSHPPSAVSPDKPEAEG